MYYQEHQQLLHSLRVGAFLVLFLLNDPQVGWRHQHFNGPHALEGEEQIGLILDGSTRLVGQ